MTKNVNLIGISGKKQSGKDTIGNIIDYLISIKKPDFNNLHYKEVFVKDSEKAMLSVGSFSGYKKIKFADKLKDIVCILLGCTREQLEDSTFKETPLGEEWVKYELSYTSYDRLSYCNCPDYYKKYFCSKEEALEYIKGNLEVDRDSISILKIELTPRLLLQLLGTECGRNIIHPDIWVNATMAKYTLTPDPNLTITEWKDKKSFSQKEALEYIYPSGHKYPKWIISDVRFPNEAKAIKDRNGILIRVNRNPVGILNKVNYTYPIQGTLKHVNNELQLVPHESETALDNYENWDYVIDNNGSIRELYEKIEEILIKERIIWKT